MDDNSFACWTYKESFMNALRLLCKEKLYMDKVDYVRGRQALLASQELQYRFMFLFLFFTFH